MVAHSMVAHSMVAHSMVAASLVAASLAAAVVVTVAFLTAAVAVARTFEETGLPYVTFVGQCVGRTRRVTDDPLVSLSQQRYESAT